MHRLYNPNSGEHFYTASSAEKNSLVRAGWKYEGIGWNAPATSGTPVYRLYNANEGDHHHTTNSKEKNSLVQAGWKYEGIGWYSDDSKEVPLYRQYNPNAKSGAHNFTTSLEENNQLVKIGWKYEGISWYGVSTGAQIPEDAGSNAVSVYKQLLQQIRANPRNYIGTMYPKYTDANPTDAQLRSALNSCKFAIEDVNGDGTEELLVQFKTVYAPEKLDVWSVNASGNPVQIGTFATGTVFYSNGNAMDYNSSLVDMVSVIDFQVDRYNSTTIAYETGYGKGFNVTPSSSHGTYKYSASQDADGDGVIYYLWTGSQTPSPLTKAEYQTKYASLFPDDLKVSINHSYLTEANVNSLD